MVTVEKIAGWTGAVLLIMLVYGSGMDSDFSLDGRAAVRDNPVVHRADPLEILATDYWAGFHNDRSGLYRPLAVASLALSYSLSGADPRGYHLADLLLHAAIVLSLVQLTRSLGGTRAHGWWAGMLFACHPVASEAVLSIVGRADLLAALACLTALRLHLVRRPATRAAAALLFAVGLLCKESAIVFPALAMLTEPLKYRAFSSESYKQIARRLLPTYALYAAVALAYAGVRWSVLGGLTIPEIDQLDNPLVALPSGAARVNAVWVLARYLGLLALPVGLSADYSWGALQLVRSLSSWSALGVGALCLSLGLLILGLAARSRWWALAAGWLAVALLPVANLLLPVGTMMAERLLYLPLAGWAMGLGAVLASRRRAWGGVLILVLGAQTLARGADWSEPRRLYERVLAEYPGNARAWRVFGQEALAAGEAELAAAALERALAAFPGYYEAENDLGIVRYQAGRYEKALTHFRRALRIRPDFAPAWLNAGLAYHKSGDDEAALEAVARAVLSEPEYVKAHYNLGILLLEQGRTAAARTSLQNALRLEPGNAQVLAALARLPGPGQ